MKLPDELSTELEQHRKDSDTSVQAITLRSIVAGVPFIGGSIMEIFNDVAQKRAQERIIQMFDAVKIRLEGIDADKVDYEFLKSAEFQTLLLSLLERIHTTHDAEKLKMFGIALANSSTIDFKEEAKEDYVRILRDLSLKDLRILDDSLLKGWTPHTKHINYQAEVLVSLARLEGMGLVLVQYKPLSSQGIDQPPRRQYALSSFGERFSNFVATPDSHRKTKL